jgi:hypothetical protein
MKSASILGITKARQYENTKSENDSWVRTFVLSCFRDCGAFAFTIVLALGLLLANRVLAAPTVGAAAPEFTATDMDGKQHKLSDFKGKFVVLEWHNQGCPYVVKHYDSGNMQKLQKQLTGQGVSGSPSSLPRQASKEMSAIRRKYLRRKRRRRPYFDPDGTQATLRREDYAAHVHRRRQRNAGLRWRDR